MSEATRSFGFMHLAARDVPEHGRLVTAAAARVAREFEAAGLDLSLVELPGPPVERLDGLKPLDILQLGLVEKLERQLAFLLVIVDTDLTSGMQSYSLAYPSQLLNIGIVSTARLRPEFWGEDGDSELAASRLATLMLHTAGHLFGLRHDEGHHPMREFDSPTDLDPELRFTEAQRREIRERLPREARDHTWRRRDRLKTLRFAVTNLWPAVTAALRTRPWRLALRFSTFITVALSLIIVLFFSAEVWDLAGAMQPLQTGVFALSSIGVATWVLYRAFALRTVMVRRDRTAETVLVTSLAAMLSLLMTTVILATVFAGLMYVSAQVIFPQELMQSWTTVQAADTLAGQIKLAVFLGAMGVLAGSLGGAAQDREIIRQILFLDEET